ncbi:glycoside hydrolase family 73 protein [Listeria aquatica]|uniref:glycoside hydrolase family 73 protein n=1 Tax=Listeria aquatica TaxID=1494960 RepID=UPI0031F575A2
MDEKEEAANLLFDGHFYIGCSSVCFGWDAPECVFRIYGTISCLRQRKTAFHQQTRPRAQQIQKEHNILTSVTLAQAILESNWGKSELAIKANNLFGVKGSAGVPLINMTTKEFQDGKWIEIKANFRKYTSFDESLDDHANLFLNGTSWAKDKYRAVIDARDYKTAAKAIMDAGYATDPTYASKLTTLIEDYDLTSYDEVGAKVIRNQLAGTKQRLKKTQKERFMVCLMDSLEQLKMKT